MRTLTLLTLFCLVTFSGFAQSPEDKESVKEVIVSFQNDFNDGQFRNAPNYTTSNWEHVNPNGE